MMPGRRLIDVLRDAGVPDLVEILAERMPAGELDAVLREVHRRRGQRAVPREVLAAFRADENMRPSAMNVARHASLEVLAIELASEAFEWLALSPICPLGTVSALSAIDPGSAWMAGGHSEIVSDCRAVLALQVAARRRGQRHVGQHSGPVRLATIHRELHLPWSAPLRDSTHGAMLALCTAGALDEGTWQFETSSLLEQMTVLLRLLEAARGVGFSVGVITATLYQLPRPDLIEAIRAEVIEPITRQFPMVRVASEVERCGKRGWFAPAGFVLTVEDGDEVEHRLAVGGLVDWTRQLLEAPEESVLVATLATERLVEVAGGR